MRHSCALHRQGCTVHPHPQVPQRATRPAEERHAFETIGVEHGLQCSSFGALPPLSEQYSTTLKRAIAHANAQLSTSKLKKNACNNTWVDKHDAAASVLQQLVHVHNVCRLPGPHDKRVQPVVIGDRPEPRTPRWFVLVPMPGEFARQLSRKRLREPVDTAFRGCQRLFLASFQLICPPRSSSCAE